MSCSCVRAQAPESTDYANYFCTYAYIYHQVGGLHGWRMRPKVHGCFV